MAILGIYDGHNAGAALISERTGQVLAAVEEERFSRIKNHDSRGQLSGPHASTAYCVGMADEPVSQIAIGLEAPEELRRRAVNNFLKDVRAGQHQRLQRAEQLGMDYHDLLEMPYLTQMARVQKCLDVARSADVDVDKAQIHHVPHHRAHAAGAYLLAMTSKETLVVTLDGKGDDLSGTISLGSGHRIDPILDIPTLASLGHLYSAFTVATGLRPQRDEGKLMALAASGTPNDELHEWLSSIFSVDSYTGNLHSTFSDGLIVGPFPDRVPSGHNDRVRAKISGIHAADAAATVQRFLEELVCSLISVHVEKTELTAVALSGGVFANVSLNRKISELPNINEMHVHPGMTDSGIALGAATHVYTSLVRRRPEALSNLGLGPSFEEEQLVGAFKHEGYMISRTDLAEKVLARKLAEGSVVGRFVDGVEYGPRALGMRSILAPAHDPLITANLNSRLGRSQIMPFAPLARVADGPDLFQDLKKVQWPTRFMATAVACKPQMKETARAAVHRDGTARPQLVDDDTRLATLLSEYIQLTGRKTLINTSYNLHDEPIVCSPEDAARSARAAELDFVQIGRLVAERRG